RTPRLRVARRRRLQARGDRRDAVHHGRHVEVTVAPRAHDTARASDVRRSMSDRYMEQLSDYLDGALDAPECHALEEHLAGCDECRTTLDELRAIVAQANALAPVEPATDLWPAIAARIESERELMMPLPADGGGSRRRLSFTIPQLAAAAVVLVLASGGSAWMLRGGDAVAPTAIAPAGAVVPVSSGSTDADLAELEAVLATGERQLDPATV